MNKRLAAAIAGVAAVGGATWGIAAVVTSGPGPDPGVAADCSVDVSQPLQNWLNSFPGVHTWNIPAGSCYRIDSGLTINAPQSLTINGGKFLSADPHMANPVFWITSSQPESTSSNAATNVTLENMTITGSWDQVPGHYQANGAAIRSDGAIGLTISNVTVNNVTGDGLNLEPHRYGGIILNPTEQVTVTNMAVNGAGRRCYAPVSVNGATFTNVTCTRPGLNSWDFEADQANEGAENVVVNGCNSQGFIISSNAWFTGPITVENCTASSSGSVALFVRSTTGTREHGPLLFENDTFTCHGAGGGQQCLTLTNAADLTVADSTITFTHPAPVYIAQLFTHLTLLNDTVTNYSTPGTSSANSTVTTTGGTWTPNA